MAPIAIQTLPQAPHTISKLPQTSSRPIASLKDALAILKTQLSSEASILFPQDAEYEDRARRFSEYKKPTPGAVVCPATQQDIVSTVKWATANGVKFLARAGGHGWSMGLSAIGPEGIVINLRDMNRVVVDAETGTATLQAGTTTGELLKAAQDADAHVVATACDSVGAVPSIMGGGIGNLLSNYGLASDNILSARVVTASGSVLTASPSENADLFWALRGAGPSFGIVSELTVKAHAQINNGMHWSGMLGFPGSNEVAQKVVKTIQAMGICEGKAAEGISCTMVYGRPAPVYEPTVLLKLSFNGSTEDAMTAFAPLFALTATYPPNIQKSSLLPADEINNSKDSPCSEGGSLPRAYRPVHSASLKAVDAEVMGGLYERWEAFTTKNESARETLVRANFYDYRRVRDVAGDGSAFAWRQNPINILQYWAFNDSTLEDEILALGQEFRAALNGSQEPNVIMSFGTGDEKPQTIYGDRLEKLQALKSKYDPSGVFSFYNSC